MKTKKGKGLLFLCVILLSGCMLSKDLRENAEPQVLAVKQQMPERLVVSAAAPAPTLVKESPLETQKLIGTFRSGSKVFSCWKVSCTAERFADSRLVVSGAALNDMGKAVSQFVIPNFRGFDSLEQATSYKFVGSAESNGTTHPHRIGKVSRNFIFPKGVHENVNFNGYIVMVDLFDHPKKAGNMCRVILPNGFIAVDGVIMQVQNAEFAVPEDGHKFCNIAVSRL